MSDPSHISPPTLPCHGTFTTTLPCHGTFGNPGFLSADSAADFPGAPCGLAALFPAGTQAWHLQLPSFSFNSAVSSHSNIK